MSEMLDQAEVEAALTHAETGVAGLLGLGLERCSDTDILTLWRRLEALSRRLAAVDHGVIGQVRARHLEWVHGAKSITVLARDVLRISVGEAHQRVKAAEACGPRAGLGGAPLPPVFPHVAAAQAAGVISPRQARVIVSTVQRLPERVQAESGEQIEAELVGYATRFDADDLATLARRYRAVLDPDGLLREVDYRHRHRALHLRNNDDGSARLSGELTAEVAAWMDSIFDSLAKPRPAGPSPAERDPRTPPQRRHDALLEALKLTQRAELVPNAGGVTCTVLLTGTVTDWSAATGTVSTGHGATIPTSEAQRWVGGDARFLGVLFDSMRRVQAYGSSHRLFTEQQRLVMAARDGGCSFPACDAPPGQCQAHHMTNYSEGGATSTDNGALMCSSNHRDHERQGWHGVMIDGRPAWIPPTWIDQQQTPETQPPAQPRRRHGARPLTLDARHQRWPPRRIANSLDWTVVSRGGHGSARRVRQVRTRLDSRPRRASTRGREPRARRSPAGPATAGTRAS